MPPLGLGQVLTYAIRVSSVEAARIDAEVQFQDLLSTLEWAAVLRRSKSDLICDIQTISFDNSSLLKQLSQSRKPVIFAPLHMGCFALPFAKLMFEYFADRPMLILRAREDRPEETLAMQRISEIGVDMRFLNVGRKQNFLEAIRFARAGAVIVTFIDLPASYGSPASVSLFGKPAGLAMGLPSLARVTGASVVPLSVQSSVNGDVVRIGRPFESYETGSVEKARVADIVRRHIEQAVLANPDQWHMWPRLNEFLDTEFISEAA